MDESRWHGNRRVDYCSDNIAGAVCLSYDPPARMVPDPPCSRDVCRGGMDSRLSEMRAMREQISGHHVADGLYFIRMPDGSVKLAKTESGQIDDPIYFEQIIPPDAWASVVASVSAGGEEDERFYAAKDFNDSTGPVRVIKG